MYGPETEAKIGELERQIRKLKRKSIIGSVHFQQSIDSCTYIKITTMHPGGFLGETIEITVKNSGEISLIFTEEHNVVHLLKLKDTVRTDTAAWNNVVARIRKKWSARY